MMASSTPEARRMPGVLNLPLARGKPGSLDLRPSCFAEKRLAVGDQNTEPRYPIGVLASTGERPASAHQQPIGAGLLHGSCGLRGTRKHYVGAVPIDGLVGLLRQVRREQAAAAA